MSFSDGIRRQTDALKVKLDQAAAIAVTEMLNSVKEGSAVTGSQGTPRDTGFAINSWAVNGASGDGADDAAKRVRAGDVVTITGGAVYLRGLEEGRARRKPSGWVRLTIAQWPAVRAWALARVGLS